ncbi:MAG TPA: ZIP family metal transporter [Gemmatimonadota bacterium]|nr:ZIP family metal transporter [Gemmatimonadota bacterium]
MSALGVFAWASLTALATGLGAVPFLFVRRMSRLWLGLSNAIAAGFMTAASAWLIGEGLLWGPLRTALGVALGVAFIVASRRWFSARPDLHMGALRGVDAARAMMIVGVMAVHSMSEGVGVGVSFVGGETLGAFITVAIAVHNVPEGLAICLVLVPRGEPVGRAAAWSVFSSLPQPLLAVPAFLFVETFESVLPVGLGFAAGAMGWMVASALVPDALADAPRKGVAAAFALSVAAMLAFQLALRG